MASRLARTNAVTVGDVMNGSTLLEIDCVDRVYLTSSVPSLVMSGRGGQVPGRARAQPDSLPQRSRSGGGRRSAGRWPPSPGPMRSRC
jgi:hypothetical protein